MELFPELERKSFLTRKDRDLIGHLALIAGLVQKDLKKKGRKHAEETLDFLLRLSPPALQLHQVGDQITPILNVPGADPGYITEHLLETIAPETYQRYLAEKQEIQRWKQAQGLRG